MPCEVTHGPGFDIFVCRRGWGVAYGAYLPVVAVSLRPNQWVGEGFEHFARGALFVLPRCWDREAPNSNALFPETLRRELHGARSVIEAYSKRATLGGREQATACGLLFAPGAPPVQVRAHGPAGVMAEYQIDRWD